MRKVKTAVIQKKKIKKLQRGLKILTTLKKKKMSKR